MIALVVTIFVKILDLIARFFAFIIVKLKLLLPAVYIAGGLILNAFLGFLDVESNRILYNTGLILCCLISLTLLVKAVTKPFTPKYPKRREIPHTRERERNDFGVNTEYYEVPDIYEVNQNPNFLMYEYENRYELYRKSENGLKYVRTDFKKSQPIREYKIFKGGRNAEDNRRGGTEER